MSPESRTCGSCNLCCKVMAIEELGKSAGVWCRHATPGQGCGIYGQHPASCKTFQCLWLMTADVPEALKPERAKVVLAIEDQQLVAHCDPADPTAWRREPMYSFLKRQTRPPGRPPRMVVVKAGPRVWLITPEGDHDIGDVVGKKTFSIEPGPDGRPTARLSDPPSPPRKAAG